MTPEVNASISLRAVTELPPEISSLAARASAEGFTFGQRLTDEWREGGNRFDRHGEVFFCAWMGDRLVGFGGLSCDPYSLSPEEGRVRHVYVDAAHRQRGVGRVLLEAIVARARPSFERLRLSTQQAAPFYERLGFEPVDEVKATHALELR